MSEEKTMSELIVTEAVEKAMDTPLRESILDGVDAAGEGQQTGRRLPLAGALFGLGAAIGFLAGRETGEIDEMPLDDIQEPEIIEDVVGSEEPEDTVTETTELEDDSETGSGLPKLLLVIGAIVGAVFLRRRLSESESEEWEPIEEFEPATATDAEEETNHADETDEPDDSPSQHGTDDGPSQHGTDDQTGDDSAST